MEREGNAKSKGLEERRPHNCYLNYISDFQGERERGKRESTAGRGRGGKGRVPLRGGGQVRGEQTKRAT